MFSLSKYNLAYIWYNGLGLLRAAWYLRKATSKGEYVRIWGRPVIRNHGKMIIGDHVRLVSTIVPIELVVEGGTLEIHDRVFINYGCSIGARQMVRIGPNCGLGSYVMILDNNFHYVDPERRNETPDSSPVILEENVMVASRVIILPGVTIGAHSVIGAGSVVTRDIPPRTLAAGIPAKVIRNI